MRIAHRKLAEASSLEHWTWSWKTHTPHCASDPPAFVTAVITDSDQSAPKLSMWAKQDLPISRIVYILFLLTGRKKKSYLVRFWFTSNVKINVTFFFLSFFCFFIFLTGSFSENNFVHFHFGRVFGRLKASLSQSSEAVWKSRWTSWAPVPNKPTVSVDLKQHSTNCLEEGVRDEHLHIILFWPSATERPFFIILCAFGSLSVVCFGFLYPRWRSTSFTIFWF